MACQWITPFNYYDSECARFMFKIIFCLVASSLFGERDENITKLYGTAWCWKNGGTWEWILCSTTCYHAPFSTNVSAARLYLLFSISFTYTTKIPFNSPRDPKSPNEPEHLGNVPWKHNNHVPFYRLFLPFVIALKGKQYRKV